MISYLLGAIQDTFTLDKQPEKPPKEEIVEEVVIKKREVVKSFAPPRPTMPAFNRPRDFDVTVRPSYIASEYTYSRQSGWLCYNDERLIPLIKSFSELEIMPRVQSNIMGNLALKNLEKIVLVYLFTQDGSEQKLNQLMEELRGACGGVLHLVLVTERTVVFDTRLTRKADQFPVKIFREGDRETLNVDEETHRRLAEFVKPETLHAPLNFQPDFTMDFTKPPSTYENLKTDFSIDDIYAPSKTPVDFYAPSKTAGDLYIPSKTVGIASKRGGETVKSSGAPGRNTTKELAKTDFLLDTLTIPKYSDNFNSLSYTPNTASSFNGSATYNYETDYRKDPVYAQIFKN